MELSTFDREEGAGGAVAVADRGSRSPVVSVDDHVVEPADLFRRRLPEQHADRLPRVVTRGGVGTWVFGSRVPARDDVGDRCGTDAAPLGAADRIAHLDRRGVSVSVAFPSAAFGYAGEQLLGLRDPQVALLAVRAYNDWLAEEWTAADPTRFLAQQLPWLLDPRLAAEEIRGNAGRGFRSVTFVADPEDLGLPSIYAEDWDVFFQACEETATVVAIHLEPAAYDRCLFGVEGGTATGNAALTGAATLAPIDWLYAQIPVRFPNLRVVFADADLSWVPMMHQRLRRSHRLARVGTCSWRSLDETPEEAFQRAFWFSSNDPFLPDLGIDGSLASRLMIGVDHPGGRAAGLCYRNACEVFRLDMEVVEALAPTAGRP